MALLQQVVRLPRMYILCGFLKFPGPQVNRIGRWVMEKSWMCTCVVSLLTVARVEAAIAARFSHIVGVLTHGKFTHHVRQTHEPCASGAAIVS